MKIVGHRGAAGLAPENTLASIRAGIKAGADWVEFDVRATKDGRVVLMHDSNLKRTTGKSGLVSRLTYAQLKRHKVSGQAIPTLAEALNEIDGQAKAVVELKSAGCADTVVQAIESRVRAGAKYGDFLVGSFKPELLREVRWLNHKIKLLLFQHINPYHFLNIKDLKLDVVGFHHRLVPSGALRQADLHDLKTYVYTVNSPRRAKKFARRGLTYLATNWPDKV